MARFGSKPKIIGKETCKAYRDHVPTKYRILGIAGTFNSGTNYLYEILYRNCNPRRVGIKKRSTGVQWQVNWGKHRPVHERFENRVHDEIDNAMVFPVVVTRDPYTWMQSMCKIGYAAQWYHVVPDHCPNLIPNHVEREWFHKTRPEVASYYQHTRYVASIMMKANYTLDKSVVPLRVVYGQGNFVYHQSLAHLWKDWYQEYYNATFPRLMVRLEDLVFHPAEVITEICDCVGGKAYPKSSMSFQQESAKDHMKNHTNLSGAMKSHIYSNRTKGMTLEDLEYAEQVFKDSLMSTFGYAPPAIPHRPVEKVTQQSAN